MSPHAQRFICALGEARGLLALCSTPDLVELRAWAVDSYWRAECEQSPVALIDAELERRRLEPIVPLRR